MEETPEMATEYCDNCKKDVPVQNYLNHSIHCPRNIRLCPKCDEPYPIVEMDKHISQDHVDVVCPECCQFMEAAELTAHQSDSCPKRMVSCLICEIDLPVDTLLEHLDYCGSRSDRCDGCGKTVLLKYRSFHLSSRHALTKPQTEAEMAQVNDSFFSEVMQCKSPKTLSEPSSSAANRKAAKSNDRTNERLANRDAKNNGVSTTSGSSNEISIKSDARSNKVATNSASRSNGSLGNTNTSVNNGVANSASPSRVKESSHCSDVIGQSSNLNRPASHLNRPASDLNRSAVDLNQSSGASSSSAGHSNQSTLVDVGYSLSAKSERSDNSPTESCGDRRYVDVNPLEPTELNTPSTSLVAPSKSETAPAKSSAAVPSTTTEEDCTARSVDLAIVDCVNSIAASLKLPDNHSPFKTEPVTSSSNLSSRNPSVTSSSERKIHNLNASTMSASSSQGAGKQHTSPPKTLTAGKLARNGLTNQRLISSTRSSNGGLNPEINPNGSLNPEAIPNGSRSRTEVLVPQRTEPKITPVNQAPLKTRRINFSNDALNEYMLRLEEHGLSNGLSGTKYSDRKSDTSGSNSTKLGRKPVSIERNLVKQRAAEIRRDREEKMAKARANNITTTLRSHITRATTTPANIPLDNLLRQARVEHSLSRIKQHAKNSHVQNPPACNCSDNPLEEIERLYDQGLLSGAQRKPAQKLTRSASTTQESRSSPVRKGSGNRARPSNFDALNSPCPRRDHEVLTRSELRGLNDTLDFDRQIHNRNLEEDRALCLPCEFCDAPIPMDHLILHQTGCRPDLIYH